MLMRLKLLTLVLMCSCKVAFAQQWFVGAEFTNLFWASLNNAAVQGKSWGNGVAVFGAKNVRPALSIGYGISAGELRESVEGFSPWQKAPYAKLDAQLLWSPAAAFKWSEKRYGFRLVGGYSAHYIPEFTSLGFSQIHMSVGVGARQWLTLGKKTGLFLDVFHHQRLGADFRTMFTARTGFSIMP
jgi:hypothetical protein